MERLIEQRYFLRQNFLAILGLGLCCYFSWHILAGERSCFRLFTLQSSVERVSAQYDSLHTEREGLERKVVDLRPGTLDRDFLEERAQIVLGYAHPGDHMIVYPEH
ncbi:MAG: septum formation initiator family protein [Rhodospirillales bacterium]|nr:septum formation initiator family protein [Rhodospirillales bacterium]